MLLTHVVLLLYQWLCVCWYWCWCCVCLCVSVAVLMQCENILLRSGELYLHSAARPKRLVGQQQAHSMRLASHWQDAYSLSCPSSNPAEPAVASKLLFPHQQLPWPKGCCFKSNLALVLRLEKRACLGQHKVVFEAAAHLPAALHTVPNLDSIWLSICIVQVLQHV